MRAWHLYRKVRLAPTTRGTHIHGKNNPTHIRCTDVCASLVFPTAFDGFSVNSMNSGGDWEQSQATPHDRSEIDNEPWHHNGYNTFGVDDGVTPTSEGVMPGDTGNGLYWFWDPIWNESLVRPFSSFYFILELKFRLHRTSELFHVLRQ